VEVLKKGAQEKITDYQLITHESDLYSSNFLRIHYKGKSSHL